MIDFLKNNIGGILSVTAISGFFAFVLRFFNRSIFEVGIHSASNDSFAFVLDSERNSSAKKFRYYAHVKITLNLTVGEAQNFEAAHLVLKESDKYFLVNWPAISPPENVREFFGADATLQTWEEASGSRRLTIKGVAECGGEPFSNLPSGGYTAFAVFVLKRFTITVPLRLASLGDGTQSTICGSAAVRERLGGSVKPEKIAKEVGWTPSKAEKYSRLRLCVLDFDFLPLVSPFWSFHIKKR